MDDTRFKLTNTVGPSQLGFPLVEVSSCKKLTYNDDGSLSFPNDVVRQLAERIQALQAQVANGTFILDREDYILSWALGMKEHPGQARGVGLVPWQIAFENDKSTYKSRGRNNARKIASVREELLAMFEAKRKEKEAALTCHIPGSNRSGTSFSRNLQLRTGTP